MHICYLIVQVEGKITCLHKRTIFRVAMKSNRLHKRTIFRVAIKNKLTFYKK